jgi:hypothetical protein
MTQASSDMRNTVLLIGGPDAGKSNFLFRLWIAIDAGKGLLVKDGLPSDLEYLRNGAERLLEGHFAGHTSKEVRERVSIPVKSEVARSAGSGLLILPDGPGEQVLAIHRKRQWSEEWESLISKQCSCLLFVRPDSDEVIHSLDWAQCFATYGAVLAGPIDGPSETSSIQPVAEQPSHARPDASQDSPPYDSENLVRYPTQVVLTEWLQFLRRAFTARVDGHFRPRVGIVLAAWDAVPHDHKSSGPTQYLRVNFPLLSQYIESNPQAFDFEVFGVSVVNGDLAHDRDFADAYAQGTPNDFGVVVHDRDGAVVTTHDMTMPVAWALGLLSGS